MAGRSASVAVLLAAFAVLAPAAGGATKPRAGSYSGKVGTFSISFRVSSTRTKVTGLKTNYENTLCSGIPPSPDPPKTEFPAMTIHGGRFNGSARDGEEQLHGHFKSSTEAVGVVSERFKVPGNPDPCDGEARFTVKLGS